MEHSTRTWSTNETLAIAHLREWSHDRMRLRNPKVRDPRERGYVSHQARSQDAAIVRCIDFEKALDQLPPIQRAALIMRYRDHMGHDRMAIMLSVDEPAIAQACRTGRRSLAHILDRNGLL